MGESAADVLIVGVSARGLAESAANAGLEVFAVDAYGDLDLLARARAIVLPRDLGRTWSPMAATAAARAIPSAAVAYTSNLENYPTALARLGVGRALWGNPAGVVRQVRDPILLAREIKRRGMDAPRVRLTPPGRRGRSGPTWLLKPRRSGGGHGIRPWLQGGPMPGGTYLQEEIDGLPGSISFVADGRHAVPLGLSRQVAPDPEFGGTGLRYCGSLLCGGPEPLFPDEQALARRAEALAAAVTEAFGLVGLNSVDFVARDGVPWPVEVNPRYSASMELIERAHGVSMFTLHREACGGRLPASTTYRRSTGLLAGKAIVFARRDVTMGTLRRWWADPNVRDVPHPRERVPRGRPICTVFAQADSALSCHEALVARAAAVYAAAARAERSVA